MALVYSYIRFSTKKQLDGDSLRRQVEMSDEWIRRNGHTLAEKKLHDLGRSGFHARHLRSPDGKLREFLGMIESGRIKSGDILLVENLDRLSRQAMSEARKVFELILEAGVKIAVLRPYERLFTKESISDPFGLMEPLMAFHLAYIESKNKSDRLRKKWDHKRADAVTQGPTFKFDKRCPSWVSWDDTKKAFVLNDGAAAVRFIFEATADGIGQRKVLATLQEKFKPIGVSKHWNGAFVAKVVNDRAVLGERQPKTNVDGKRVAVGFVIKEYYPAVIDEPLWYRAQVAKAKKLKMKGPNGQFVNLFTGIVFNAHDGQAMHIQVSRTPREEGVYVQRRLVSSGHTEKRPGSDPVSVDYFDFEAVVLSYLNEVRPEDLGSKTGVTELRAKEQELRGIERHLARIEDDMSNPADEGEYQSLKASSAKTRKNRNELRAEVEKLKGEVNAAQPLLHAHDTLKLLAEADDDQRHTLRLRLRSLLAELLDSVYVKPEKHFGRVYCLAQLNFTSGLVKSVQFGPGFKDGSRSQHEVGSFGNIALDLREKKAAKKIVFRKLAEALAKPAPAPDVKKIPTTVGAAAELFLRVRKANLAKASFRVVPSKVRRFVGFVGADTATKEVGLQHWRLFVRWLRAEVSEKKLDDSTARVTHNRVREFLRWLIEQGATPAFDFGGSAAEAMAR